MAPSLGVEVQSTFNNFSCVEIFILTETSGRIKKKIYSERGFLTCFTLN